MKQYSAASCRIVCVAFSLGAAAVFGPFACSASDSTSPATPAGQGGSSGSAADGGSGAGGIAGKGGDASAGAGGSAGSGGGSSGNSGASGAGGSSGSSGSSGAGGSSGNSGSSGAGGSSGNGGSSGGSGSSGNAGSAGGPDTCPVASGAFTVDVPPGPGTDTSRRHALLQVPTTGPVRVFATDFYQNGSFYDANLIALEHTAPQTWTLKQIANGGIGLSIARSLATIHGSDPCVVYTYDYDGRLHLQCASTGSLVIAPLASGGVSAAELGASKFVVYTESGTLHSVTVSGIAEVPDVIDTSWSMGATSLAVDSLGNPHVAYVAFNSSPNSTVVKYATRNGKVWKIEEVETDAAGSTTNEGDSVSLVLVADSPVLAYYHRSSRSLKMARRQGQGFVTLTLDAPQPGYDDDIAGTNVALRLDCQNRMHLVYQRNLTIDPQPNLKLFYARIAGDLLEARQALPLTASTAYAFSGAEDSLDLYIGPAGEQYVAAQLGGLYGNAVYFASR